MYIYIFGVNIYKQVRKRQTIKHGLIRFTCCILTHVAVYIQICILKNTAALLRSCST